MQTTKVKWNQDVIDRIARQAREGLSRAGEAVAERAQEYCPVDTGALRDSIEVKSDDGDTVTVGSSLPYAAVIEFGSAYVPPRPFLREALNDTGMIADKVAEAID